MKPRLSIFFRLGLLAFCCLVVTPLGALDPLTELEKQRLANVETAAKRTPAMRESAALFSTARKAYLEERKKFSAQRDPAVEKQYRSTLAQYEQALRKSMETIDPTIKLLLDRRAELNKAGLGRANEGETVADADSPQN